MDLTRSAAALRAVAGLMGAGGVGLAALGAHRAGSGNLAVAAQFLLVHAAVALSCANAAEQARRPVVWLAAALVLAGGTVLFGLDLALIDLVGARPVPAAAPIGGFGMIIGWSLVAGAALLGGTRHR